MQPVGTRDERTARSGVWWLITAAFGALTLLASDPAALTGQEQGTVQGQVIDRTTMQPVANAQVFVVGGRAGSITGQDGRYRITGVPAGQRRIRVRLIGFREATRTVQVAAGETVTADFELETSAISLEQLVVTTTGQQRRREVANAVSSIDAAQAVETAPATDFSDLLTGRASGVQVLQSSGVSGTGSKIRIRGSSSVSLSNAPLVYLDGVRISAAEQGMTVDLGGQSVSRLDDINTQNIESMEVVKGPSAATLYGTEAANGVIRITTKSGREGSQFRAWTELASVNDGNEYPGIWQAVAEDGSHCPLIDAAAGDCQQQEVRFFNLLENEQTSPFSAGSRLSLGGSLSGATETTSYYVSGERGHEDGTLPINEVDKVSLRVNSGFNPADDVQLDISTGFIDRYVAAPDNDNSSLGIMAQGLLGSSPTADGWWRFTPEQISTMITFQDIQRLTGSAGLTWQAADWLEARFSGGIDYAQQEDVEHVPVGQIPRGRDVLGRREENRIRTQNYTAEVNFTANRDLTDEITSETSVGGQYFEVAQSGVLGLGEVLVSGTRSLSTAALTTANEFTSQSKTLGGYLQERVGFNDRLFVTAGVRMDDNSAFGNQFDIVTYPKVSASWVVSDEEFFPDESFLQSLRLRAAWGQSGTQPGVTDALTFLSGVSVTSPSGSDEIGVTFEGGGLGNPNLKPERSSEIEVGFDAQLFNRGSLYFTFYDKTTEDALIFRDVPPSVGAGAGRFENLGKTRNRGVEGELRGRLLEMDEGSLDLSIAGSYNDNELLELGEGVAPIAAGGGIRQVEGYPLTGYWSRTLDDWSDTNGDGIIVPSEVSVSDTAVFIGPSSPKVELTVSPSLRLFDRFELQGLLSYRGGHYLSNSTASFRCGRANTRSRNDPQTPLFEQARCVASAFEDADGGYIEKADHLRLQEISLAVDGPDSWTSMIGASSTRLVLSARNLGVWTDYTGVDPSANRYGQENFSTAEFLTVGPARYLIARVRVNW